MLSSPRLALVLLLLSGCARDGYAAAPLPAPARDLPAPAGGGLRTAVFAAGCFWCVEAVFEPLEGVTAVVSGYAGGTAETARYELVGAGKTEHAEAVQVTYDPARISYGTLLHVLFTTHDPTTLDRQGPDRGRQYRSAIFFAGPEEQAVAAAYLAQLDAAKVFPAKVVTALEPLRGFFPAEDYHQDFVALHPDHGYVRQWVPKKLAKLRAGFAARLKPAFRE
jgi:peptide-methionine (S)-S-oxide reductase